MEASLVSMSQEGSTGVMTIHLPLAKPIMQKPVPDGLCCNDEADTLQKSWNSDKIGELSLKAGKGPRRVKQKSASPSSKLRDGDNGGSCP